MCHRFPVVRIGVRSAADETMALQSYVSLSVSLAPKTKANRLRRRGAKLRVRERCRRSPASPPVEDCRAAEGSDREPACDSKAEERQTKVGDEAANIRLIHVGQSFRRRMLTSMHLTREERDMKTFATSIVDFLKEEDGPTAVEYAVMVALIAVVVIGGATILGGNVDAKFNEVATEIAAN